MLDLSDLLSGPFLRGSDRVVPGTAGVVPYTRERTLARHTIPMVFIGDYNQTGVAQADPGAGLWNNIEAFKATAAVVGLLAAVLTEPDGVTTHTANVQFESFVPRVQAVTPTLGGRFRAIALATYDFSIPTGLFT